MGSAQGSLAEHVRGEKHRSGRLGGLIALFAGFALFGGAVWARTVGVIVAVTSAIVNFAWMPWYPVWAITLIAINVTVIWALTAHGRDIVE